MSLSPPVASLRDNLPNTPAAGLVGRRGRSAGAAGRSAAAAATPGVRGAARRSFMDADFDEDTDGEAPAQSQHHGDHRGFLDESGDDLEPADAGYSGGNRRTMAAGMTPGVRRVSSALPRQQAGLVLQNPGARVATPHPNRSSRKRTPGHSLGRSLVGGVEYRPSQLQVTVFGFALSRLGSVIRHFQQFGTIVERKRGSGNWVVLRYAEPLEASLACDQNGRVIDGDLMIGVKFTDPEDESPCFEDSDEDTETSRFIQRRVPLAADSEDGRAILNTGNRFDDDDVLFPRPRRSVCTAIMEYLFRW